MLVLAGVEVFFTVAGVELGFGFVENKHWKQYLKEFILQDFLQHLMLGNVDIPRNGCGDGVIFVRLVREQATENQDLPVMTQ